jgi:signal transduction histidine kinase
MPDDNELTVLVVDDEADIRDVTAMAIADAGYRVETAADGRQGIERCRTIRPQIVVTDVRMPGLDGIQLLEAIKTFDPLIEVVVVTAFGEVDIAIQALQRDASDFITKPINHDALMMALQRAAGRHLTRRQLVEYTAQLEHTVEDQARILHQDKMMSLGRLAASVVHEINNPLSGILNYCRLMLKILQRGSAGQGDLERFQGYLRLVESETDRCSQIVSGLLAFSRKSPPRFEAVDIADLLEKCLRLSRHKMALTNIDPVRQIDAGLPPVRGDFNQLQQCVINLVFNAIDAMPEGGRITIAARRGADPGRVTVSVGDTGIGIAPENRARIFEPFFTTKQTGHGTGLGLSTVFGIIDRHGGSVSVHSRPGEGATFSLDLPVSTEGSGAG